MSAESSPMLVLRTPRLALRRFSLADAEFVLELLNEPSFIRNIGDRGVRTLEDARQYIRTGPLASYEQNGFGLYVVELGETPLPIGMCGLLRRAWLGDVDIGFAFLPKYWSKGYALESATAVKALGLGELGLARIVAITSPDNDGSIRVLERIGLRFERMIRPPGGEPEVRLFTSDAAPDAVRDPRR